MGTRVRSFISSYWVLILLICIKMIMQYLVINPVYELHRDEFLYLDQGKHLAFGYISVPPFTAVISKIIYLLGGGLFWIRFFPGLFGSLTIVFTWLIVESLGGSLFAKIVASTALVFSLLLRINFLFQPNSFDVLAWTVVFYFLIRYFQSENSKWLYYLSLIVAVGFYNKYTLIFLVAGLAAGLILTYRRRIFADFSFWKAMILCLALLTPNIIWQVVNHYPVFQHMKVLKVNQLDNNTSAGFLYSQLIFFIGSLPLTLGALAAFIYYKTFRAYRFAGVSIVTVITLFALMKAKSYYSLGIFPALIAFGSLYFDKILSKKWRMIVFPSFIFLNMAVFLLTLRYVYPLYSPEQIRQNSGTFEKLGLLRWEDGKNHDLPQDYADMLGWKEMAQKTLAAYEMIPAQERDKTLVLCSNYGEAGAMNYYNRSKMPEAYAFNTDYIYWLPRLPEIKNIMVIGKQPAKEVAGMFTDLKLTGVVETQYAREKNTSIYLLTGAKNVFTEIFYKEVEARKTNLDIF